MRWQYIAPAALLAVASAATADTIPLPFSVQLSDAGAFSDAGDSLHLEIEEGDGTVLDTLFYAEITEDIQGILYSATYNATAPTAGIQKVIRGLWRVWDNGVLSGGDIEAFLIVDEFNSQEQVNFIEALQQTALDPSVSGSISDYIRDIDADVTALKFNITTALIAAAVDDTLGAVHGTGSWEGSGGLTAAAIASAVDDTLGGVHGTGTWDLTAGAIATAVDDTLTAAHPGDWASTTAGSGSNVAVLQVRDASSSAIIAGARVTVSNSTGSTTYADVTTGSTGDVSTHLDTGAYTWTASSPGNYNGATSSFTVATDPDTFAVNLTAITLGAAADPDYCAMVIDAADFFGTSVDSIEVRAQFDGEIGVAGSLFMLGRAVSDTTGTPTSGRATVTIPRSSSMSSLDGVTTWTFTFIDRANVSRRGNKYPTMTIDGVTVPDASSANLSDNLPQSCHEKASRRYAADERIAEMGTGSTSPRDLWAAHRSCKLGCPKSTHDKRREARQAVRGDGAGGRAPRRDRHATAAA